MLPGHNAEHSHPFSAEILNEWGFKFMPLIRLQDVMLRSMDNFTYTECSSFCKLYNFSDLKLFNDILSDAEFE
jgi:hypothetical protein